jgi:predicted metal-dependent enzyme (double-stranded beta helix superfamily)
MAYSLEEFCQDGRRLLAAGNNHESRDRLRQNLEKLLIDEEFAGQYLQAEDAPGPVQIYEDADYGFCVLVYNMAEARVSPPHDHGTSWAIYGQARGHTDMQVWESDEKSDDRAVLKVVREFRLEPGMAGLFDVGEIHSIDYVAGAKFVRVTGTDMAKEARKVFDPESGRIKKVEHVGTG